MSNLHCRYLEPETYPIIYWFRYRVVFTVRVPT